MKTRIIQDDPERGRAATGADHHPRPAGRPGTAQPRWTGAIRSTVARHPVVTFFVLSYLIGWSMLPWGTFAAFAPLLSALIVVPLADGVDGLRRLGSRVIRWRVGWVWYAVAVGVPLLVHAAAIAANVAAGAPVPSWAQFTAWSSLLLVFGTRLVNPLDGPLGEEPGWRGFAQPRVQATRSPLLATAVLAAAVTGWHLPLVVMAQFDLSPIDLVSTVAVTFWYAWLFNHTGGSVLLTLVAHATEGSIKTNALWPAGANADRQRWTYMIAWVTVVVVLLVADRRAWRRAPEDAVDVSPARVPS